MRTAVLIAVLAASGPALAHPASIVPGGQDPDPPDIPDHVIAGEPAPVVPPPTQRSPDVLAEVDYAYELSSSTIVRERIGAGSNPDAGVPLVRDLDFTQFRHTITPRLHIGIVPNTFVYGALPIVIAQAREHSLVAGLGRADSSTVIDGIVPESGFDARDAGTPPPPNLLFRGPGRRGLDQVHVGIGVAPMNQLKDPTKPTWKLGAELRVSVGKIMKFDPMAPEANAGVSQGIHELKLWTTFARKLRRVEPWIEVFWQVPLTGRSGSLFNDPGYGSSSANKGQQAGIAFGLELFAIDQAVEHTRISLDVGTKTLAHFEGRDYTEMWEVFAFAGEGPLLLDDDPTSAMVQPLSHPGISNVENYLETSGRFAIRAQIGPHVRFAVTADVIWKTDHAISFADAGVDHPTCGGGETPCEDDDNDLVNPGTDEVNPLHAPLIDLVGHRYLSVDNFDVAIGVQGQVTF